MTLFLFYVKSDFHLGAETQKMDYSSTADSDYYSYLVIPSTLGAAPDLLHSIGKIS
jgi:hypothetical protein